MKARGNSVAGDEKTADVPPTETPARRRIFPPGSLISPAAKNGFFHSKGKQNPSSRQQRGLEKSSEISRLLEDQGLLWLVFAFAVGILIYFLLPEQPDLWVLSAGLLFLTFGVFRAYSAGHAMRSGFLVLAVVAGVFCAGLRTYLVDAPRLSAARTVTAMGVVVDRDATRRGLRLLVDVEAFSGPGTTELQEVVPMRIRVSVPSDTKSSIGDAISLQARLFPPAGPVRPGGYDFSFRAYFERIGATGFSYGAPQQLDAVSVPILLRFKRNLLDLREGIGRRIRALLPGATRPSLLLHCWWEIEAGSQRRLRKPCGGLDLRMFWQSPDCTWPCSQVVHMPSF